MGGVKRSNHAATTSSTATVPLDFSREAYTTESQTRVANSPMIPRNRHLRRSVFLLKSLTPFELVRRNTIIQVAARPAETHGASNNTPIVWIVVEGVPRKCGINKMSKTFTTKKRGTKGMASNVAGSSAMIFMAFKPKSSS